MVGSRTLLSAALTSISSNILNRPAEQMHAENRARCVAGPDSGCPHTHERKPGPAEAIKNIKQACTSSVRARLQVHVGCLAKQHMF
jgi:hypothetical protein